MRSVTPSRPKNTKTQVGIDIDGLRRLTEKGIRSAKSESAVRRVSRALARVQVRLLLLDGGQLASAENKPPHPVGTPSLSVCRPSGLAGLANWRAGGSPDHGVTTHDEHSKIHSPHTEFWADTRRRAALFLSSPGSRRTGPGPNGGCRFAHEETAVSHLRTRHRAANPQKNTYTHTSPARTMIASLIKWGKNQNSPKTAHLPTQDTKGAHRGPRWGISTKAPASPAAQLARRPGT